LAGLVLPVPVWKRVSFIRRALAQKCPQRYLNRAALEWPRSILSSRLLHVRRTAWQGAFLIKGLGFTQGSIGLLGALPAGASVILVIAAGWSSQRLLVD
jgi:hypothetical protein